MRYVSINTVAGGSTGGVMHQVTEERRALGDECWCMWGRGRSAKNEYEFNFNSKAGVYIDALLTRFDGRAGFHSKHATRQLLKKLDEIHPDVVHLHNLHGYYINIELLFGWLIEHDEVQVKWTLHDCWAFTGHCAHFTYVKCAQWQPQSACSGICPQLGVYPSTISKTSCAWNYNHKRSIFTRIPEARMTLITPSHWLEGLVRQSFLSQYPIEVRHNSIDLDVFKPTMSDFRDCHGVGNRFMVLGVANPWTERKGLGDFVKLSRDLQQDRYAIVLVGLNKKQIRDLPGCIVKLERTESPKALAEIYTAADVFFNPTYEDNYPTVNLEAEACELPVITYDTGGCVETIKGATSLAVSGYEEGMREITIRGEWKKR